MNDNSMLCIHPYNHKGTWVFDDPQVGLYREPFVSGADVIIDEMVKPLAKPEKGFTLLFSLDPFPGHELVLDYVRPEFGGNWYQSSKLGKEGWLCPALTKYLDPAPPHIYAQFKERRAA